MKLYFAGLIGAPEQNEYKHDSNPRLFSYYELTSPTARAKRVWRERNERMKEKPKVDLFLDSGAYSAVTQGAVINIQDYIKFIKENKEAISIYANLDVIGDAAGTWKNQQIMEKAGLSPLPVFHQGEDETYLRKYIEQYEYIALGGMVGTSSNQLIYWLDRIFPTTCDEDGMPKIKVHGFGLTSLQLMLRYPWYSVDSTSWVITGRMGNVFVPRWKNGKWTYDENSWKVTVSSKNDKSKEAGQHINTFSPEAKKTILRYFEEKGYKLGKSEYKKVSQNYELAENEKWADKKPVDANGKPDKKAKREVEIIVEPGLSNTYQLRDELNIVYFLDLEKSLPEWPWPFTRVGTGELF